MTSEKLDLDVVTQANVSPEAARILMQTQEWYQKQRDKLSLLEAHLENCGKLEISGLTIDDPEKIKWLMIGVSIAASNLSDFPVKVGEPTSSSPEDDHEEA